MTLWLIVALIVVFACKGMVEVVVPGSNPPEILAWDPSFEGLKIFIGRVASDRNLTETEAESFEFLFRMRRATADHQRGPAMLPRRDASELGRAPLGSSGAAIALYSGHDASIAVSIDGVVQCVLELERLFNVRYFDVSITGDSLSEAWLRALRTVHSSCQYDNGKAPHHFDYGVVVLSLDLDVETFTPHLKNLVETIFAVERWKTVDHHEAHALLGFHDSPYRSALVLSYDGGGNDGTFNVYVGTGLDLHRIARLEYNAGRVYDFVATLMQEVTGAPVECSMVSSETISIMSGQTGLSFAGKLMGYAAAGEASTELREHVRFMLEMSGQWLWNVSVPTKILSNACQSLENQRTLAASAQKEFEDFVLNLVLRFLVHVGAGNVEGIVLTGGGALNVLTNQKINDAVMSMSTKHRKRPLSVHVPVAPNDCGLSVGGLWSVGPPLVRQPLQYLGFDLWDKDILDQLARSRGAESVASLGGVEYIAELLTGGPAWLQQQHRTHEKAIIAVVRGRQEFGPRALGHRSLLAVPDSDAVRDRLNRLKARQWYRPVAPMVADEALQQVFGRQAKSPYMSMAPRVREDVLKSFPAMAHIDSTARFQSVGEHDEPWVHSLLLAVGRRTGLAALINTSLNTRGKPITNSVVECLEMLDELEDLDYLVLEDWLFRPRHAQEMEAWA